MLQPDNDGHALTSSTSQTASTSSCGTISEVNGNRNVPHNDRSFLLHGSPSREKSQDVVSELEACGEEVRTILRQYTGFPPPLESPVTSDHGCNPVCKGWFLRIRRKGRLTLRFFPCPPPSYMHVERRDGRLILRIFEESDPDQ
ncbi:hypothetical protein KP509_09G013800 [Ceratopteris richardii]|uniref:FAF domain-containing protein n=1 Tax=Ceratopteris richardii TaxID=49495 RepID=A0A8T2U0E2_CERRI|nr:hypothetical protein KP509_09G013800 [Ceratopteris richardii]